MRILFISPNPIWGGAATANITFAKMLGDNGHQVFYCDEYCHADIYNGITILHYPFHGNRFKSREMFYDGIRDINPEIIVWLPMTAIYYYCEIKQLRKKGIKQFVIMHSLSLNQNLKGRTMDFLVSQMLTQIDTIIFVSKFTLESWMKFPMLRKSNAKKVVIHNISPNNNVESHLLRKPIRIGFVGRFSIEKQPEIFCRLSEFSDYEYHAWGDGPLLSLMKSKYPKVIFHGMETDINSIYCNIDVLLLTSKFENCPMVVLEAKSFGIPCVAPNVGGIPEIVVNNYDGLLYDDYNTFMILNAITEVLKNYKGYSSHCISNSKNYEPHFIYEKWKGIIN